jgi:hypothetical protein
MKFGPSIKAHHGLDTDLKQGSFCACNLQRISAIISRGRLDLLRLRKSLFFKALDVLSEKESVSFKGSY